MVTGTLTQKQAKKLMEAATRDVEQTSASGVLRAMISVNVAEVRKELGKPSADNATIERMCGSAFIRFGDDGQKVHLDHTVLSNIASQGLVR